METIFKSAMNHIKAKESTKRKTEEYVMEKLANAPSGANPVGFRKPLMKKVIAAACAVVLVCGTSIGAYAYYKTPTSYLSLDINPSVELGVNPFGKIVSAMAYNKDGKTILDGQSIMGSNVSNAVSTLVKSAAQKGFIAKDGSTVISVTSETDSGATAAELQDAAAQGADSAVKAEGDTATILKDNIALARRDEARKLGITPGKLNLIQKLQALDPSITVDEYKDAKVTAIMNKYVELKKAASPSQGIDSEDSSSSEAGENSQAASGSEKTAAAQARSTDKATAQTSSGENGKAAAAKSHTQTADSKSAKNAAAKSDADSSASETVSIQAQSASVSSSNTGKPANAASRNGKGSGNNNAANSHKK